MPVPEHPDRPVTAGAVYSVSLTPADIGARVAVRRTLAGPGNGDRPVYGDVLGELVGWSDGALVIRTRAGLDVHVEETALVAGRRIPAAPPRRRPRPA